MTNPDDPCNHRYRNIVTDACVICGQLDNPKETDDMFVYLDEAGDVWMEIEGSTYWWDSDTEMWSLHRLWPILKRKAQRILMTRRITKQCDECFNTYTMKWRPTKETEDLKEITKEYIQREDDYQPCMDPQGPLPDTGARRSWDTGAVRDASEGKPEITQIYPEALLRLAKRGTDGAKKYEDYNFTKGIPLKTYVDSLYRHLAAYQSMDTSEDHLAAIMWNAMGLMFTEDRISDGSLPPELDDLFDWGLKKR